MILTKEVEYCLEQYPATRNSDIELTIRVWLSFHVDKLVHSQKTGKWYAELKNLFDLPREDNIKRIRAKIQNVEGRFLPTDPKIWEERQKQAQKWQRDLGYGMFSKTAEENAAKRVNQ